MRVVGLGEATHGTREFFTLKHRLIEFLVIELGVRVVAMEASESAAVAVDDYVTHSRGDPGAALQGLGFWTWNTREVLGLLEWLRGHNADLPPDRRVRFVGIDAQLPGTAVRAVEGFLAEVAAPELPQFAAALEALPLNRVGDPALPPSTQREVEDLLDFLDREATTLVAASSPDRYARVRRHAAHLVRSAQLVTAPRPPADSQTTVYAVRDRLMADAVTDAVEGASPAHGPAVAVWAHNGHVQCRDGSDTVPAMGAHLRRRFGPQYYALGLTSGSGSFRARRSRVLRGPSRSPVRHRLGAAPPTTVEGHLAAAHPGDHLVDLRDEDAPEAAIRWLGARAWTRAHGAVTPVLYRAALAPMVPGGGYDGLGYVHHTRPSVPAERPIGRGDRPRPSL